MNEWMMFFFLKKKFLTTAKNENENYIFMFCIQPSSSSSSNWIERYRTWMFSYWPNKTFFHYVHTPFDWIERLCWCVGEMETFGSFIFFFFCWMLILKQQQPKQKKMLGTHTGDIEVCRWLMHSFFSTIIKWWIELRSFRFWQCKKRMKKNWSDRLCSGQLKTEIIIII